MQAVKTKSILPVAAAFLLGLGWRTLPCSRSRLRARRCMAMRLIGKDAGLGGYAALLWPGAGRCGQDEKGKGVSEAAWRDFLDTEVTPRFPAGLSVVDVYGQWQGKKQKTPERLRSKMLVIDLPEHDGKCQLRSKLFVRRGSSALGISRCSR